MTLTLSVLRCPDAVPPEMREVRGGEYSIGRGPDNEWTLADPDKFLSKRHCVIAFRGGGWQLADTSTNGTFLNRDADPVGPGAPRDLRDGDRLRLGNYEIEIRIQADVAASWGSAPSTPSQASPFSDPFGDDPFGPAHAAPAPFGDGLVLPAGKRDSVGVRLPNEFDALEDFDIPFSTSSQSDHAPGLEHAFRPPEPAAAPPPAAAFNFDNWDLDLSTPAAPAPAVAALVAAPAPAPAPEPPKPAAAPPVDVDDALDPFAEADVPSATFVPAAAPAHTPVPPPVVAAPPPFDPPPFDPPAFEAPVAAPVPVAAALVAPPVPAPAPVPVAAQDDLLKAFLRGAGMEDAKPADAVVTMERLGAAFRSLVGGLRQALIARAAVKGEFRIEQTMIRARGNNPLKFSAGDDDAMAALLGAGRRADMAPADAIGEVLRDMRLHELATMSAMQAAVRALLTRLDPGPLREEGEKTGGMLPGAKRAKAFEAFEKLYNEISAALADDFDSVFGKAFARAYEQALREAGDRDGT